MDRVFPWRQDTERAGELTQERTRALARINLAEDGRRVTLVRRAETHFGREHPIACFRLAGRRGSRFRRRHVEHQRDRGERVEQMKVGRNQRDGAAAHQRRFQSGARGAGRLVVMGRAGSIAVVVMGLRRSRGVTRRLLGTAVADAEVAMREAEHLRRDPNQQRPRRERAEQRTESCLARTHFSDLCWRRPCAVSSGLSISLTSDRKKERAVHTMGPTPHPRRRLSNYYADGGGNPHTNSKNLPRLARSCCRAR